MRVHMKEKVQLTETMSLLYVQNKENSLCRKGTMCLWEGQVVPVVNICMESSCGCSLEACNSTSIVLRGGHSDEWSTSVGGYTLILKHIQYSQGIKGEYLDFQYYIE